MCVNCEHVFGDQVVKHLPAHHHSGLNKHCIHGVHRLVGETDKSSETEEGPVSVHQVKVGEETLCQAGGGAQECLREDETTRVRQRAWLLGEAGRLAGRRWAGLGSNKEFLLLELDDKRKEAGALERRMDVE